MYNPLPKNLTIRQSQIDGLGLFATEIIPANTDLGITHIHDERFTDEYIRTPLGGFFNHSSTPNCKVFHDDAPYKHIRLITLQDINPGEELTAYYTLYVPEPLPEQPEYELRGYGLLPYNIKPVQAGIQYSHSIVEYVVDNYETPAFKTFIKWAKKFKTAVLLDGGTSNHSKNRYSDDIYVGTMENHAEALRSNGILFSEFYEPDLNDMLAAIFLIVDERVFNKKKYPDFGYYYDEIKKEFLPNSVVYTPQKMSNEYYAKWVENIGGEKNVFLRNYITKLPSWR